MDVKTKLNYLHIPPRKVRLMAAAIRGMDARRAEIVLAHAPKRAALPILKLLRSTLADAAHNFQAGAQSFYVKEIRVDPGPVAKRTRARAFGRAAPIRKRTSHIVLVLGTRDSSSVVSRLASVKKPHLCCVTRCPKTRPTRLDAPDGAHRLPQGCPCPKRRVPSEDISEKSHMTHRVHPYIFRINQLTTWRSRWFSNKKFSEYLREDTLLREWLVKKLRASHIEAIEMERSPGTLHIIIKTSRPGTLIGRGGEGAEKMKKDIEARLVAIARRAGKVPEKRVLKISIEEVRSPKTHAAIAAQMLVEDLEKRVSFRRALKTALEKTGGAHGVLGVKIAMKGRLDGAEMARYEWAKKGRIPLATLRADIDYAEKTAYTAYGTIGVKVWIYKGDVFEKESRSKN